MQGLGRSARLERTSALTHTRLERERRLRLEASGCIDADVEDDHYQHGPPESAQTVQLHTRSRHDSWPTAASTFVDLSLADERMDFDGTRPSRVGPFEVGALLGAGGMGVVYEARDPRLDRKVALKLVRSADSNEKGARARIMKEARGLASVSHPHVVQVYASDVHEDEVYVAMEFLSGGTLKEWLAAETRPWPEIVRVFLQAGEGLIAAHARGLVHRDFKPDNVIFHADGRAKVTDFGLVGKADTSPERTPTQREMGTFEEIELLMSSEGFDMTAPITRTGALMGTPAFMAPEQFLGRKVGPEADQWAFCVALYWALF
ncbi:MAG: serine/threonine-protein kinase, partial [Nannocystaceae bacterium]